MRQAAKDNILFMLLSFYILAPKDDFCIRLAVRDRDTKKAWG
jgi:hypothetical protein